MTKFISFTTQKGGDGKTTNNLYSGLMFAHNKKKVLLVDADEQHTLDNRLATIFHTSLPSKIAQRQGKTTFTEGLDKYDLTNSLIKLNPYIYVLPATEELHKADQELQKQYNKQGVKCYFILGMLLDQVCQKYGIDVCLIDNRPSLNSILSISIMLTCEDIIITQASQSSLESANTTFQNCKALFKKYGNVVNQAFNHETGLLGVMPVQVPTKSKISSSDKFVLAEINKLFKGYVFKHYIKYMSSIRRLELQSMKNPRSHSMFDVTQFDETTDYWINLVMKSYLQINQEIINPVYA